jgi:biotin carboxyl carrier protein
VPDYEISVDGKPRKVALTRMSMDSFTGKIDGRPVKVGVQTDKIKLGQAFTVEVDGKTYKVEVPRIEKEKPMLVRVDETTFRVEVKASSQSRVLTGFEPATGVALKTGTPRRVAVEGAITAPMTGKILKVKVKRGDRIEANQVLCIIEAMKMENEITASKAGTVQEVNVGEGSPVNEGDTLFVVS